MFAKKCLFVRWVNFADMIISSLWRVICPRFSGIVKYGLSEMDLSEILLGLLLENTYLILGLGVFAGALGVPIPTTLLIIAAGAFSAQGFADFKVIIVIVTLTAVFGDCIGFFVGGKLTSFQNRLPSFIKKILDSGKSSFHGCSKKMIFFSRFLFTAIGTPINILSGFYMCKFRNFIPYVFAGELIWALEMTFVGYWFGTNIELIYEFMGNISMISVILLAIYVVYKKLS